MSGPPLTWREARCRLRTSLAAYVADTPPTPVVQRHVTTTTTRGSLPWILSCWWNYDLDVCVGSLGSALAILLLSVIYNSRNGLKVDDFEDGHFKLQSTAGILLFLGSLINLWLIQRRRRSNHQGNDSLKRREILTFLKEIEKQEEERLSRQDGADHSDIQEHPLELDGTALAGVYPVYRRKFGFGGESKVGSWCRVPTLLLVQGDHIALQIGDVAPATCKLIEEHKIPVFLKAGEIITLKTYQETSNLAAGKWPRGRTTLPPDSDRLLTLCNNMRIFEVIKTPLEAFLKQPRVESRSPQVLRQLESIRVFLSGIGVLVTVATVAVLFARIDMNNSVELALALPVPFLAAVAIFPTIMPACLIVIEALGTARILSSFHPVATLRQDSSGTSANIDLLLLRYFLATVLNRLSMPGVGRYMYYCLDTICKSVGSSVGPNLVLIPPASLNLLEKLGVATAFTLVDDALVCEPQAVPQQLLVPSGTGLKLLDICPTYEDESSGDEDDSSNEDVTGSKRMDDFQDSDEESDDQLEHHHHVPSRKKRRRLLRKAHQESFEGIKDDANGDYEVDHEVQFEDPLWWQHLPSLKCIGLAGLLVEDKNRIAEYPSAPRMPLTNPAPEETLTELHQCKKALVRHICTERRSTQLRSLAQCIGFSTKPNRHGAKGDISYFEEKHRLLVVSSPRVKERLEIDSHERDSEESRWWGLLRTDSTSVIVQDHRSGSYQLFTVGDPRVVTRMCNEAWQGENSTILPLSVQNREMILETSNGWRLGDLDVEAFSYAPVPHTFESRCMVSGGASKFYLLENDPRGDTLLPTIKDKAATGEWPLLQNQIFLGVLGSLIIPRQETQGLLSTLQDAGVRFIFMSPRNMRLTKEIASQMGIDIAWNAAISLRPLDEGKEDEHRMISNYADWDVNAKLPHGIEAVKDHLKNVDNVPLLVSLFTDVNHQTTREMIEVFQEYNDTVIAVGLSHLPWNSNIFSTSDLGIGVDVLSDSLRRSRLGQLGYNCLLPSEIVFISAISAHTCAFRLRGLESIAYMPTILAQGRASLEAATSSALFLLSGCLSFGLFTLFGVCSVSTVLNLPEVSGAFLSLQVILPLLALPMTMSDPDKQCMARVPAKNDLSVVFGKREGRIVFNLAILKALPPAILPQFLYLIAVGELLIFHEPELLRKTCGDDLEAGDWPSVIFCDGLGDYAGVARRSAAILTLGAYLLCITISSAGFVYRICPLTQEAPWTRNAMWVSAVTVAILIISLYVGLRLDGESFHALPWYYYLLGATMPFVCLACVEYLKRHERTLMDRAEKLRRLQFETRLGMWSPK